MLNIKNLSRLAVAAAAVASASFAATGGETAVPATVVKPLHAAMLQIGLKRTTSFYVAADNKCNVTLVMADGFDDTAANFSEPMRINVTVGGGESARIDTAYGPSLDLQCATGATTMSVAKIDRVAGYVISK